MLQAKARSGYEYNPVYDFTVGIGGFGDSQGEAWGNAVEAFCMDPKEPVKTELVGWNPRLAAAERHRLPASAFGLPKQRKYPMPDRAHVINAKTRAKQMLDKDYITKSQYDQIVRKANRIIERERVERVAANLGDAPQPGSDPIWDAITSDELIPGANPDETTIGKIVDALASGDEVAVFIETDAGVISTIKFDSETFHEMWIHERGNIMGRRVEVKSERGADILRFESRVHFGKDGASITRINHLKKSRKRKSKKKKAGHKKNQPIKTLKDFLKSLVEGFYGGGISADKMQSEAKLAIKRWAERQKVEGGREVRNLIGKKLLKAVGIGVA